MRVEIIERGIDWGIIKNNADENINPYISLVVDLKGELHLCNTFSLEYYNGKTFITSVGLVCHKHNEKEFNSYSVEVLNFQEFRR